MEQLTGTQYLDNPETVAGYRAVMDELASDSLSPASSIELIRQFCAAPDCRVDRPTVGYREQVTLSLPETAPWFTCGYCQAW